ncbi:MAG: hypothetical protein Q8P06_02395 [Candidatus Azambacteria bacterium]|nr:hypothetical protein [Candidatus Azambacteria bacterium]
MKIKYFVGFFAISLALIGSVAWAQERNIQFPVKELGDCQDKSSCKSYCDKPENIEACIAFAEKNDLMSKDEIKRAKKFITAGSKGPGGCNGKDNCENFCNNITNIDECVAFAEKNDLMPPEELKEARMVQAAIKRGVKPPPCGGKQACDTYCEDPSHMEECISFGAEAGFIQGRELEDARKMLTAIKRGVKPLPCKGKKGCDAYCSSPDNMEICMNFAMEAGFMDESEKADSQKMLKALKKGVRPPNCRGRDECDAYCSEDAHVEECINFSVAAGFMDEKDAEMAKRTKGKGPGDCKGKDECKAFCNNPDNQETCFNFGKDNGLIPEADLKRMEEDRHGDRGESNRRFQPGPGVENPGGKMMPQQAGPGGCKGPEECKAYCESNPDNCKNFSSPQENRDKMMPKEGEIRERMMMEENKIRDRMTPPKEGEERMISPENREGMMQSPEGYRQSPEGGQFQQPQNFQSPMEQIAPVPAPALEPAPQTLLRYSPFGAILNFFLGR